MRKFNLLRDFKRKLILLQMNIYLTFYIGLIMLPDTFLSCNFMEHKEKTNITAIQYYYSLYVWRSITEIWIRTSVQNNAIPIEMLFFRYAAHELLHFFHRILFFFFFCLFSSLSFIARNFLFIPGRQQG